MNYRPFLIPVIYLLFFLLLPLSSLCLAEQKLQPLIGTDSHFKIVEITDGLDHPWAMAFLPD